MQTVPQISTAVVKTSHEEPEKPLAFFDPEATQAMIAGFASAWAMVVASGHVCAADQFAVETRRQLAIRVIECGRSGERDPSRLRAAALSSLFPLGLTPVSESPASRKVLSTD